MGFLRSKLPHTSHHIGLAAAASQSQPSPFHSSDEEHGGPEVDYEPDSGMDDVELAQYWPPVHVDGVVYSDHELEGGPMTPPNEWIHEAAGVLPAGADYPIFGVGNLVPGNWDPVNHQYVPWNEAWNEEKQEYVFPWGGGNNHNLDGLPHHHPQHPEDWEPGDPVN